MTDAQIDAMGRWLKQLKVYADIASVSVRQSEDEDGVIVSMKGSPSGAAEVGIDRAGWVWSTTTGQPVVV